MTHKDENLFWPVYLNLEQEVAALSYQIHFDDHQLQVYSLKIAELLIRVSVEIEALAKELFFLNGGTVSANISNRNLYFDTDCLELLENKWLLSKKIVLVTAANSYFEMEENKVLTPLYKANKRDAPDWKKGYQAVKHNRSRDLKKGNLKNLIRAMAALYMLNLYYRDEKPTVDRITPSSVSLGSSFFSVKVSFVSFDTFSGKEEPPDRLVSSVCLQKLIDRDFTKVVIAGREDSAKQKNAIETSNEFAVYLQNNPSCSFSGKHLMDVCKDIGGVEFMQKIRRIADRSQRVCFESQHELVLNKNTTVYSEIDSAEIL